MTAAVLTSAESGKSSLKFDENWNFRILHISDTHFTDFPFEESIAFIERDSHSRHFIPAFSYQ